MTPGGDETFELGTDGPTSILVGVDGSTTAARAGWYAAGLARRQGARVVAVYVEPGPGISGAAPGGGGGSGNALGSIHGGLSGLCKGSSV